MAVEIWFRNSLSTERVEGDLVGLAHNLNIAASNGKQFALLTSDEGGGVMVKTDNIICAKELDGPLSS